MRWAGDWFWVTTLNGTHLDIRQNMAKSILQCLPDLAETDRLRVMAGLQQALASLVYCTAYIRQDQRSGHSEIHHIMKHDKALDCFLDVTPLGLSRSWPCLDFGPMLQFPTCRRGKRFGKCLCKEHVNIECHCCTWTSTENSKLLQSRETSKPSSPGEMSLRDRQRASQRASLRGLLVLL